MSARPHPDPSPSLSAHDLVKTYRGGSRQAPRPGSRRSLPDVRAGAVFGLLGPNGAGKSTTVKILSTLTRPDGGRAVVAGIDVTSDPDAVRRAIGLISQKRRADPMMTGRESLLLAARIHGHDPLRGASRATELLDRFDLTDAADRPHQDLQRRHAAQARHRHGPGRPANGAVPRRTHDRPRPRGPRADVGRDRPPGCRRTADRPAHDALPRRGGPPRRPARDRRPRSPRRRGHPRRAQERLNGDGVSWRSSTRRPPPLLRNAFRTSPGSTMSPTRVGCRARTRRRPASSRACWRRWTRPAWRSTRPPSPDRLSTTSTSTTPAAASSTRHERRDRHRVHRRSAPCTAA